MGNPDFRVDGRIFATLAAAKHGYGNIMITPEQQAAFVEELPEVFIPVAGGWGRNGATHIRLEVANEDVVAGALRTAWKLRVEKNAQSPPRKGTVKTVLAKAEEKKLKTNEKKTAVKTKRRGGLAPRRAKK